MIELIRKTARYGTSMFSSVKKLLTAASVAFREGRGMFEAAIGTSR
jgi:hypothetical protein